MRAIYLILIGFVLSLPVHSQEIFPSGTGTGGSYNMTYPPEPCADPGGCLFDLYNLMGGGNTAAMTKGSTYQGPFQTHNWWNSALWHSGTVPCLGDCTRTQSLHSGVLFPWPAMHLEAKEDGQVIRHRELALNGGGINNTGSGFADEDIKIGMVNSGTNTFYTCSRTEVMDYGNMHVKLRQDFGGGNILDMTASSGCPFTYFEKQGAAEPGFFLWFLRCTTTSTSGNAFTIHRSIGYGDYHQRFYSLFFPPGTTISGDDGATYNTINSIPCDGSTEWGGNNRYFRINLPPGMNYFTVAVVPDTTTATLDLYEQHAFDFITDTRFTYTYDEPTATLTNAFNITTNNVLGNPDNGPLLAQYLHQYRYSPQHPANYTGINYTTARGEMRVCTGNSFTTEMKNYGFLPALGWANSADSIQLYNFVSNYATRGYINIACGTPVYGALGSLHECARIAEIAHAVGNYTARDHLLDIAKQGIEAWITSPNGEYAGVYHYDTDFNWLTPFPSAFDADRLLQDSHFHHGYLIYAAAIVARFESVLGNGTAWANEWGPMIEVIIRNINDYNRQMTPPADPNEAWFPYLRYYDPYAGHSWAGHDGANQESVSEAINFAAGTALWGETTGNTAIRDLGVMLYVNETEAARTYWWDGERLGVNAGTFAPGYGHYHAAILGTDGGAYATFFGADPHYVHGITYVPITGSSLWMGVDSLGAANQYDDFVNGFGSPTDGSAGFWSTVMLMEQATYDASTAMNRFINEAVPGGWGGADYMADGLYWIATFDSVGVVDATTQADITSFGVFRKDSCKHYMIYMPPGKGPRIVNFTDGRSFNVPADTIITYKVCDMPLPVDLLTFYGEEKQGISALHWTTASEVNNAYFLVEKSKDGKQFTPIGKVDGNGNSSITHAYTFNDNTPYPGLNYYRLKQVDFDGKAHYSRVINLSFNKSQAFSCYPNPASDLLTIKFSTTPQNKVTIALTTVTGKTLVTTQTLKAESTINLKGIPKGLYFLSVYTGENLTVEKIVVE